MGKIYIIDVTNRDGVQTAKLGLSKLAKTMINMYLNELGVFQSELGFPTTRHESNYLKANLRLQEMGVLQPIRLGGWLRATAEDVERAFELVPGLKHFNLSISTSSQMIHGKFRNITSEQQVIDTAMKALDDGPPARGGDGRHQRRRRFAYGARFPGPFRAGGQGRRRRPLPLLRYARLR